jgi:uncharacterized membrane protein YraQ (UPF0718 family)
MKLFIRVLAGLLIALAIGVSLLAIYGWEQAQKQANRTRTAAATNARWAKRPRDDDDDPGDQQPEYTPPVKKGGDVTETIQPENSNNEKGT